MTKSEKKLIKKIIVAVAGVLAALGVYIGIGSVTESEPSKENTTANVYQETTDNSVSTETQNTESIDKENTDKENIDKEDTDNSDITGSLEIHYIDVGQGDATFIRCGDKTLLIDAGDNGEGANVSSYLEYQGVEHIDYVIGTHPDSDHIGGLDVIINDYSCGTILMPDEEKNTKTYKDVIQAIEDKSYKITLPEVGATYSLGEAKFTIIAPNADYSDANNVSIGILLEFGETSFLFTGDAEQEAELDILKNGIDIHADVYKAGHHGSRTSSGEEFLAAIEPKAVVVSCGEDNSYGHPHADILNYCMMNNIPLYRTDMQGTIVVKSDGKTITWNMSPYEAY